MERWRARAGIGRDQGQAHPAAVLPHYGVVRRRDFGEHAMIVALQRLRGDGKAHDGVTAPARLHDAPEVASAAGWVRHAARVVLVVDQPVVEQDGPQRVGVLRPQPPGCFEEVRP